MLVWEEDDVNFNGVELALALDVAVVVAAAVVKAAVAVAEATPPAEETGAGVWVPTTKAVKVEPASVAVEKTT